MKFSGMMLATATAAMLAAAPASAACWTDAETSAARVRDMQTMLMVSALRCKASSQTILDDYGQFLRANRPALTQSGDQLRSHFVIAVGDAEAGNAYTRYLTVAANRYAGAAQTLKCPQISTTLSAARAASGDMIALERVAREAGVEPELIGDRCASKIAGR
jgi:hypothetical protein